MGRWKAGLATPGSRKAPMLPLPRIPPLLGLLTFASGACAAWSDTLEVPSERFRTIQAAVDRAVESDEIVIAPGVYVENVVITGKKLTLRSASGNPLDTVIEAVPVGELNDEGQLVLELGDVIEVERRARQSVVTASDVVLQGLTVQNGDSGVLVRPDCRVEFLDGRVIGNSDGFELEGGSDPAKGFASGIVRNSVLAENGDDGVDVDGRAELQIEDSTLERNGQDGIEIRLQDTAFNDSERIEHVIRRNRLLGNGQDGLQLIDYHTPTPRSFRVERNVFAGNLAAGLGMMCNAATNENFEGCETTEERVVLLHNTFVGNDHGLTGGPNLIGVSNIFVGHTNLGVKKVVSPSLLAYSLFHANGIDRDEESNLDMTSTRFEDPQLGTDFAPSGLGAASDAGVARFTFGEEVVLDLEPCAYGGSAPELGALELALAAAASSVAAGDDDAQEKKGKVKVAGKRLELGAKDGTVGLRFAGPAIPPGAEIVSAHLQLTAAKKAKKPASLEIRGEASDGALPFAQLAGNLSSRSRTTSAVTWTPPAWTGKGAAGADQRTPDLAAIVQEIVDRPGWSEGNGIALLFTGTGKRSVQALEGGTGAPALEVEFVNGMLDGAAACAP